MLREIARKVEVPEALLRGLIQAESGGNPWAMRYEPGYEWLHKPSSFAGSQTLETERTLQKTSLGLCQIMGANLRSMGFEGRFLTEALNPRLNLRYGARYLKRQYSAYGSWEDAISAYNQGAPRRRDDGEYVNKTYVDRVFKFATKKPNWEWEKRSVSWKSLWTDFIDLLKGV